MNFLRIYSFLAVLLFAFGGEFLTAQNNCGTATQFCTNTLDPFPAVLGAPSTSYPTTNNNYGCLYTQPNQTWFTMTIANDGNVDFTLNNTAGVDVDFIVYGPFPNAAAANAACGNLGTGGVNGDVADCSYSSVAIEPVFIEGAQAGEVYIMLVTNYDDEPTNIYSENNVGSSAFLCDCDIDINFGVYSAIPTNTGVLTNVDTAAQSAEYVVCAPVTAAGAPTELWIHLQTKAPNATDTMSIWANGTTIATEFPGAFSLNQIPLAVTDSLELVIGLTITHTHIGEHDFQVAILTKDVTGSTCIQYIPIKVIIPGVEILAIDTTLCPAVIHNVELSSEITTAGSAVGTGTFAWSQVAGPLATTINTPTSINPTITIPANTVDGQLFTYALTYTDATGCVTSDSLNIRMLNRNIGVELTADNTLLCNTGEAQTVQLNVEIENSPYVIVNNGSFTWNTTQGLSNPAIYNPIATVTGSSAADSVTYILNYAYGTCTGADTLTINFHNASIVTTPAIDTLCLAQQVDLLTVLSDSIKTEGTNCASYVVNNIPYAPVTLTGATTITSFSGTDDAYSAALPIGFPFEFYCNDFTNIYASTNGFLSFNALTSTYTTNSTIPTAGIPNNMLAFAWDDLRATTVNYGTIGTAPNRQFVYNYLGNILSNNTATVNVQVILYEATSAIEYHITSINPNNISSSITQGIENATGSAGTVVTGRNNASFSTTNTAVRFTPRTIIVNAPITYNWTSNNVASFNNNAIHNPTGLITGQGNIYVTVQNGDCIYTDSVSIVANDILPAPVITCGTSTNNSVQFIWDAIPDAVIYEYSLDNGATWIGVVGTTFNLGGLASGTAVTIQVRGISNDGMCAIGYSSTATCTALDCNIVVNPIITNKTGCNFDNIINNGAVTLDIVGSNTNLEFTFNGQTTTSNVFEGLDAGTYAITITKAGDSSCFIVQNVTIADETGDVRLNPSAFTFATDTVSVFVGDNVQLYAGYNNPATTYNWSGDLALNPSNVSQVSFLAETEGTYTFTVTAESGVCNNTDNIVVVVKNFGFTGMPSAFTPNGDGENDIFRPVGLFGAEFKTFEVYNRWGKKVFETSDINEGWDGTIKGEPQPRDVYVYFIEFKLPSDNEPQQLRGEFTLMR